MKKQIEWLLKEKYNRKPNKNFDKDIERLKAGEPLDYVIGFTEFLDCRIDLSKKPLIPRPETEYWVEKVIKELNNPLSLHSSGRSGSEEPSGSMKQNLKILDIFAGSGCIGIAILKHVKNTKVTFAEKDERSLKQIKINLKINNFTKNRYKIIQSNIFNNVIGKFDYIFANPPYIAKTMKNKIQESVLKYEPKIALFAGKDGLFYINKFLKDSKKYLNKNGVIYMEFDSVQKKEIEKILKKLKYTNFKFLKDQYGRSRYLMVNY